MTPSGRLQMLLALGIWLMFSPSVWGTSGRFADSDHLVGALVLTVAAISTAEVARGFRLVNLLFALWLIVAPWVLEGVTFYGQWNGVISGLLLFVVTLPRGTVRERYAGWDRLVV